MAVSFANIFMAAVETEIINRSHFRPLTWKRYIDDLFSLWNINKEEINSFIDLANSYYPTIKSTGEISDTEITFLDTCVYKGERFKKESTLDVHTHFNPTETFQYTHFTSCHHREHTILLNRERVNKGTKRMSSLPLPSLVISFILRDIYWENYCLEILRNSEALNSDQGLSALGKIFFCLYKI